MGTDGTLGTLERVIADARRDCITELVVKGEGFRARLHVVPLSYVQCVDGGTSFVNRSEAAYGGESGLVDAIHGATEDYTGPPSEDLDVTHRGNMQFDAVAAAFG